MFSSKLQKVRKGVQGTQDHSPHSVADLAMDMRCKGTSLGTAARTRRCSSCAQGQTPMVIRQGKGSGTDMYNIAYLEEQPLVAEQRGLAEGAVALTGQTAKAQPVRRRKVDSLRAVEAHVEAPMVCSRECDDKFARLLQARW